MKENYVNLICKCTKSINVTIAGQKVLAFEKGMNYGCICLLGEYRVYGLEFIYHVDPDKFGDNFVIIQSNKGGSIYNG